PVLEPLLLNSLVAAQPIFEQQHAVVDQVPLELRRGVEEILRLIGRAETHHLFDAGAVVPAAVEQHDLASRRQMLDVALEIPLRLLALAWGRQRDDTALPRIEKAREHVDRPALAGSVAAFEKNDHPLPGLGYPARHAAEFLGQRLQELLIFSFAEPAIPTHQRPLLNPSCRTRETRLEPPSRIYCGRRFHATCLACRVSKGAACGTAREVQPPDARRRDCRRRVVLPCGRAP